MVEIYSSSPRDFDVHSGVIQFQFSVVDALLRAFS